jgi:hypothetical protein
VSKYRIVYDGFRYGYRWYKVQKKFWIFWITVAAALSEKKAEEYIQNEIKTPPIPTRQYP